MKLRREIACHSSVHHCQTFDSVGHGQIFENNLSIVS